MIRDWGLGRWNRKFMIDDQLGFLKINNYDHKLPITYHLSPITYHLSPITYHPLPITNYPDYLLGAERPAVASIISN